jgi:hypothetical protein
MCTGNPRQVENNYKELINIFANIGKLIIDVSVGKPGEAKPKNVQALIDTVRGLN